MIRLILFKIFDFIDYILIGKEVSVPPTPKFKRHEHNLTPLVSAIINLLQHHPYDGVQFLNLLLRHYPKLKEKLKEVEDKKLEESKINGMILIYNGTRADWLEELDSELYNMVREICFMSRFNNPYSGQILEIDDLAYMPPLDELRQIEDHLDINYK